ncbi:MAG: hypothetical protein ACI9VR_000840 [Cognaticolwellia sp.]|jgi:hypothetical protein
MAEHLSHGPSLSGGVSLFQDQLRVGIAATTRPGPINPATFPLELDETYKEQDTLQLRSDGGAAGLYIAPGCTLANGRLHLSAPVLFGGGGYGFYLVGEDRKTPDGEKPSVWEDKLLNGADSAFGWALDAGLQLALIPAGLGMNGQVRPTIGVHYHTILGYEAAYTDRYQGPSVSLGVEVRPN